MSGLRTNFNKTASWGLDDVSAFIIEITAADIAAMTNYHTFFVIATAGCKVYWGDGASSTLATGTNTCTHTYAGAGYYLVQIRGPHTRFYHYTGSTAGKVIEATKFYSGLTSIGRAYGKCSHPQFHMNRNLRIPGLVNSTAGAFGECNGGSLVVYDGLTIGAFTTNASEMFYGANLKALPPSFVLTPNLINFEFILYDNPNLAWDISNFFPTWAAGKTLYGQYAFYNGLKITGTVPPEKTFENTSSTFASKTGCFRNCPMISNASAIPAAWK